ncbi:hypothetical protein [Faecalibaculum rodentium]|uniref:hypothetical protein n=1 Tax=Faecalibaculum rodentium TaxID=1702221 RepID=UPI0023F16264|nr:hypothetical protein [Faecalibaculum rodentium]
MTLKEYIEQNGNNKIEIQEDGTIRILEEKGPWKPKNEEFYYTITNTGDMTTLCWDDDSIDKFRLEIGNVFRTEAEANRALHRLRARKKFLDAGGYEGQIKPNTKGWFVCLVKVRAAMPSPEYTLKPGCFNAVTPTFVVWFESEEDCQKAIDSLTEEEVKALCWTGENK